MNKNLIQIKFMKKLALVFLAGMSIATAANAQFQFGIKAGANFSTVSGSAVQDASTLAGFNGGVYFKLPITGHLAFQPELLYSGQGFEDNSGGFTSTQHFNYFNIPLLLKYTHFSGFFVEVGPQIGVLTSASAKGDGISVDDKSYYHSADISGVVGVGFKIPTTPLSIDARYNFGLSNIENNSGTGGTGSVRNGSFQIGLMLKLFSVPVR
jgi:Outer membrane protein beta-barrel domain